MKRTGKGQGRRYRAHLPVGGAATTAAAAAAAAAHKRINGIRYAVRRALINGLVCVSDILKTISPLVCQDDVEKSKTIERTGSCGYSPIGAKNFVPYHCRIGNRVHDYPNSLRKTFPASRRRIVPPGNFTRTGYFEPTPKKIE